jgi:hypothetical protein
MTYFYVNMISIKKHKFKTNVSTIDNMWEDYCQGTVSPRDVILFCFTTN